MSENPTKDAQIQENTAENSAETVKETENNAETVKETDKAAENNAETAKETDKAAEDKPEPVLIITQSLESIAANHEAICQQLGLSKPLEVRGRYEQEKQKLGARPYIVLFLTAAVVAASVGAWFGFEYFVRRDCTTTFIK